MRGHLIVLALSVGCGGRAAEEQSDAGAPPVDSAVAETPRTIETACAEQVDARCRDLETCGRFGERLEYASEADCRTAALARCISGMQLPGVKDALAQIDRCTEKYRAVGCRSMEREALCDSPSPDNVGTLSEGTVCQRHAQCATGYCAGVGLLFDGTCGVCRSLPRPGDACTESAECGFEGPAPQWLWCIDGRCTNPFGLPCSEDKKCPGLLGCVEGFCEWREALEGQACGAGIGACANDLYCDSSAGTCRPRLLAGVGEQCSSSVIRKDGWRWCRGDTRCEDSRCVAVEAGATCSTEGALFVQCGRDAGCVDGRCVPTETLCVP